MAVGKAPNLKVEQAWMAENHLHVGGSDEVGRGSLSGPVSAGVVIVDASTKRPPTGLRDSKLLTPLAREKLVPRIQRWCVAYGVGHASPEEIDAVGLLRALRLAGERALHAAGMLPTIVVLDGNYDWFRRPEPVKHSPITNPLGHVEIRIKADLKCASVAAASVLAKVERDQMMRELAVDYPGYGWELNKGYSSRFHINALRELGPSDQHRRSWNLPGMQGELDLFGEEEVFVGDDTDIVNLDEAATVVS